MLDDSPMLTAFFRNLYEQVYSALFGESLYGKCILDRGHVHTFDKKTYK